MNQVSNPVQKSIEKSVVSQVTPNGSWEGQYGLLYKYEITMENGQIGDINSKVQDDDDKFGWKVGSEIDYERIQKGKFINFKKHNPDFSNNSGGSYRPTQESSKDDIQDNIRYAQSINIANLQYCHGLITEDKIDDKAYEMYQKLKKGPQETLPFSENNKAPF
jgi:hypothetical protein